jgi:heme oxygenase
MLRAATSELHALVDARFSGPFDRDEEAYAGFLAALARVVVPLERALEQGGVEHVLPDWAERRRSEALANDLADLEEPLRDPMPVDPVDGEARQFGMLYVLEGSRLGGKLLLQRALAHPQQQVRSATRYLAHGADKAFWPSFVSRLESSEAVAASPDEAVAGARAAFTLFGAT